MHAVKARAKVEKKDVKKWSSAMARPKRERWTEMENFLTGPTGFLRVPTHVAKEQSMMSLRYNRFPTMAWLYRAHYTSGSTV